MLDRTSGNLAANVKRRREARGFTQQELAELSGVPRPTIANLESGSANPTLLVLLKVAGSLGATIEELVGAPGGALAVHRVSVLAERRRGGVSIRRLIPDSTRPVEFERIEILPGGKFTVRADATGTREVLACETGEFDINAGGETERISVGDVVTFAADQPRELENRAKRSAVIYRIVALDRTEA